MGNGLSETEKKHFLEELGFSKGSDPSEDEVKKRMEHHLENASSSPEKAAKMGAIGQEYLDDLRKEKAMAPIRNKFTSNYNLLEEQIRNKSDDPNPMFAATTAPDSFKESGKITLTNEEKTGARKLPENYGELVAEKLDIMNFSGGKVGFLGSSATGYIASQNTMRTMAIGGNALIRGGTNSELTQEEMAQALAAGISATTYNPEQEKMLIEGFSPELVQEIKKLAVINGFKPENIKIAAENKVSELSQIKENNLSSSPEAPPTTKPKFFNPTPLKTNLIPRE